MRFIGAIILSFSFMAFQNPQYDFDKAWKEVEAFQNEGLPQSALNKVNEIYGTARKGNVNPHLLKAISYKADLMQVLAEEENTEHLSFLRKEYDSYRSPVREIAGLILYNKLQDYYFQNAYKYSNRTFVSDQKPQDINLWSPGNFEEELLSLAEQIISNKATLNIDIRQYEPIISKITEEGRILRPTLYDLVAHTLIQWMNNPINGASDFDLSFNINNKNYLSHNQVFVQEKLSSSDPNNHVYRTLLIYQDLLSFHGRNINKSASLDVDINRLNFVKSKSNLDQKDSLYLNTIDALLSDYPSGDDHKKVIFHKAVFLNNSAIEGTDSEHLRKEALELCEKHGDDSYYGRQLKSLASRITTPQLDATGKQVYTTDEKITVNINSTNIKQLWWRIVTLPKDYKDTYRNQYDNAFQNYVLSLKPLSEGNLMCNINEYYFNAITELKLNGLALGNYAIIISPSAEIKDVSKGLNFIPFQVSNIAYASMGNQSIDLIISDRRTGNPLPFAKVTLYTSQYDRQSRTNKRSQVGTLISDTNGRVTHKGHSKQSLLIDISYKNDYLDLNDGYYIYDYPQPQQDRKEIALFTDRAIYRPGQKVFFKGILLKRNVNGIPALDNQGDEVEIVFKDVNYQDVIKKTFFANEFGSISGELNIPVSGLTGRFTIEARNKKGLYGSQTITVEEYRRPKFEVKIDQPKASFKLGDMIAVQGKAVSFSSASVTDAQVVYKVYRSELRRWWWYYRGMPSDERILINQGMVTTDDLGGFEVQWEAFGDERKNYVFTVEADVTDLSGETQTGTVSLNVGKRDVQVVLEGEKIIYHQSEATLPISVTNLSGEKVEREVRVNLTRLQDPGRVIEIKQESYYPRYNTVTPLDRIKLWEQEKVIRVWTISAGDEKAIKVGDLEPGAYRIKIKVGDVEEEEYILILDLEKGDVPFADDLFYNIGQNSYSPGEEVVVQLGSPHSDLYVYHQESRWEGIEDKTWIKVDRKSTLKTVVKADDYGGFYITLTYFYNNRFKSEKIKVEVPWSHKKLKIDFLTMRNTLLPGQEETWSLKISGEDRDKVTAEVLASMYDMSLDQFVPQNWNNDFYPDYMLRFQWQGRGYESMRGIHLYQRWNRPDNQYSVNPLQLPYFTIFNGGMGLRGGRNAPMMKEMRVRGAQPAEADAMMESSTGGVMADSERPEDIPPTSESESEAIPATPSLRTALDETVFFYPQLYTDEEGNIEIKFKMKEALTKWKLMILAHDKDLATAYTSQEVITKKDLMVFPYPPRFMRQEDDLQLSGKVTNLSENKLEVNVRIEIFNARTMVEVTNVFLKDLDNINIDLHAGGSQAFAKRLMVPDDFIDPIIYRVFAESKDHSDGEEGMLPILSNKILVTDTKAFSVKSGKTFNMNIDDLLTKEDGVSMLNVSFDYTAHPVWVAIQALPYLNDYPHDCTEQMVNKYFANALGHHILQQMPNVKYVLDQWRQEGSEALWSNLQKNEELKSAIVEETPWLRDAISESEQKQSLAILFDVNKMSADTKIFMDKVSQTQYPSGGFPWFKGGKENRYITQYVLESFGKMSEMGIIDLEKDPMNAMVVSAIRYIDEEAAYRYQEILNNIQRYGGNIEDDHLSSLDIHYLYTRSFFDNHLMPETSKTAYDYFYDQAQRYWLKKSDQGKALIGITAFRNGDGQVTDRIVASFTERAITHQELGTYWKNAGGYYWNELPIETHTTIMSLFTETKQDAAIIENLRLWLLNNKRTNAWPTTKSTAEAIHALLGNNMRSWSSSQSDPTIKVNGDMLGLNAEAGTGYVKRSWHGKSANDINSIYIKNNNNNIGWGGVYVQSFQKLENIKTSGDNMIEVKKSLFLLKESNGESILQPVDQVEVRVGDVLVNRLEIRTDRDLEFVHLKDLRASGLEPMNVMSSYRWNGGLGYYESTRDVASHFFMDFLKAGTYVFEYKLRVSHQGSFVNGIASLQCMYAPEFSSHSDSQLLKVK
jgi:uncharacterized protein YfaS (alpha-2-macroglobulin family)